MVNHLINNIPFLNINVPLSSLGATKNFICTRTKNNYKTQYKLHRTQIDEIHDENIKNASKEALFKFDENLQFFSNQIKKFTHFKPHDYIFSMNHVLFDVIEKQINFLFVNSPENVTTKEAWNDFRLKFAAYRYEKNPDLALSINN